MFNKTKFEQILREKNTTKKEIAYLIGVNESTLYRKIQNGGNFDRYEIDKIVKALEIEDPINIFFAQ